MLLENGVPTPIRYMFLYHKELVNIDTKLLEQFKEELASSTYVMGFNLKYDAQWLEESGFSLEHLEYIDPMITEYVMARGRTDISFRLADTCKRYKINEKGELFDKYKDMQISEMPMAEVLDYGIGDIQCLYELYLAQEKRLSQDSYCGLRKTIQMSWSFCKVLTAMERAGVKIDNAALRQVEEQFTAELEQLKYDLNEMVRSVMGDTAVNLDSPQQLSEVIYSRRIKEGQHDNWLRVFNIGKDERGKFLKRPKLSFSQFRKHITDMCETVMKTEVSQCQQCLGKGYIHKTKKDGSLWKKPTLCKPCKGSGAIYTEVNEIAGFKMQPTGVMFTTVDGFTTSKTFLAELVEQAKEKNKLDAAVFIEKIIRMSALSSYLSTFVGGISVLKQDNNILHANFNQTITATGRLSATKPNTQNLPREATFPIRRTFISRFEGGYIIDSDFSQVEFRAAIHLSKDEQGKKDILDGKDIHKQTAEIITANGQPISRQEAKSRSFKPLFGGVSGTDAERAYYRAFLKDVYKGVGAWHHLLEESAIKFKMITTETGRQFSFGDVERAWHGGATRKTQIVNYPVQSLATADIIPLAIMRLSREMKKLKLRSLLVLTVHDSIIIDAPPEELEVMLGLCKQLGKFAEEEMLSFYNIEMFVPLANETKYGYNAMEMKKAV